MKRLSPILFALVLFLYQSLTATTFQANMRPWPSFAVRAYSPGTPVQDLKDNAKHGDYQEKEGAAVRIGTTLISVPVCVMDRDGKYLLDLKQEDFRIYENGAEQQISFFNTVEEPVLIFLLLDASGSMSLHLKEMQQAAIAFIDQLRPADRVVLIAFNDDVKVMTDEATADRAALRDAVRRITADGGTRLFDAMHLAYYLSKRIRGRKAIVLLSDGVDSASKFADDKSTLLGSEELDALVYALQFTYNVPASVQRKASGGDSAEYESPRPRSPYAITTSEERAEARRAEALRYYQRLAEQSGGRHFEAVSLVKLASTYASIAQELRQQYMLSYYPNPVPKAGQRRQIKVRVNREKTAVRARKTYIFTSSSEGDVKR